MLVHAGRLVVLDYEVIHWGDPTFDIGFAVTHFLSKAHHLAVHRETFVSAALQFCTESDGEEIFNELAARHTLACMLARVAGRSPLEYLDDVERARQRRIVVKLMSSRCESVPEVVDAFARQLNAD